MKHYLGNVWLWLRGMAWLWTREPKPIKDGIFDLWGWRVPRDAWIARLDRSRPAFPSGDASTTITYKPGWGPWTFLSVYLLNVGSHVLLSGGAVTTWSRAAWDLRQSGSRVGKLLDRWIQALLGDDHGQDSGPVLWGSTPCRTPVRWAVAGAWTALIVWLVRG